ncbi:MAG: DUF2087 domain-containing protein [Caldilineaceae bacterium]|nr:DUF2087 domain-containing protein [Caldilineaceae bacterium]
MVEPRENPTDQSADALLKLILDEDRLVILGLAAQQPCTVRQLAAVLPGKRTPPAKHVAELVAAGLLRQVDDEQYALDVRQIQQWKRTLFARAAAPVPESSDEQILVTYVRGGKMIQYPAQQGKRLVLLRWLASHFEPGRAYSEHEVNEMLAGHSEDHATLRRYLVDTELLVRQAGIYQRAPDATDPDTTDQDVSGKDTV